MGYFSTFCSNVSWLIFKQVLNWFVFLHVSYFVAVNYSQNFKMNSWAQKVQVSQSNLNHYHYLKMQQ